MAKKDQIAALTYAVRPIVIGKYFGQLCLALAALTLFPVAVSLYYGEFNFTVRYFIVIFILVLIGIPLARLATPSYIQNNEVLIIPTLIFLFAPLIMSFPMTGAGLSLSDAYFEAVSAITTTGLSTQTFVEHKPLSFLYSRSWMQWVGGLGIIVLSVALLIGPGAVSKKLAHLNGEGEDIVGSTRAHARRALIIYVSITVFSILLLWALGASPFIAVTHTLAAISTGGFSTYDNSLAGFNEWRLPAVIMIISFAGSIPLLLYHRAHQQGWRQFISSVQVKALLIVGIIGSVFVSLLLAKVQHMPWPDAVRNGFFMAFSAQTTTGFSTISVHDMDPAAKLVLIVSMGIGGGVGSTAGGIKILRFLILLRLFELLIKRTCLPPHAVAEPRLADERLSYEDIEHALLLILLFIVLVVISWLLFLMIGYDPLDSLFEVVSAAGTVGLSTGITSSNLETFLKLVLCIDMLAGRLEIIALLVIFYSGTWFGKMR